MGSKIVYTCKAPDGSEHKRTTTSGRVYTHALLGRRDDKWHMLTCCGRPDLAHKQLGNWPYYSGVHVAALERQDIVTKDKPKAEWPGPTFTYEGVTFEVKDSLHGTGFAVAQAGGWYYRLHCTGANFNGSAWREGSEHDWEGRKFANNSSRLENVAKKLIALTR